MITNPKGSHLHIVDNKAKRKRSLLNPQELNRVRENWIEEKKTIRHTNGSFGFIENVGSSTIFRNANSKMRTATDKDFETIQNRNKKRPSLFILAPQGNNDNPNSIPIRKENTKKTLEDDGSDLEIDSGCEIQESNRPLSILNAYN